MEERETVLLLHGLARTRRSMGKLERGLKKAGFQTLNLGYPSRRRSIAHLADIVLADVVERCQKKKGSAGPLHLVTHSMGGILVRQYLATHSVENLGRVVMLAPPNHGSEIVDRLGGRWWFRWFNGPAGCSLGTGPDSVPNRLGPADYPLGIIAGNHSLDPVFSRMIPGPSDGKVSVASARLQGMQDFKVVPHGHTFIMNRNEVIHQVIFFIQHGRFEAEDS
ncbi:MAG: alpha/beta hydrolase [Desulfobulbaceae bacterium]|nr:alpha/beta hydrolase [Desulfobulbaceae bacterium]